ncbi:MAG: YitT family protein, partial [Clostridia bacterium]|nr:YitT family protein [Clostridia bacterium]
ITVYDAKGYYSGQSKKIVYFVVNRFQIAKAKKLVLESDPTAFISITETSEVLGLKKIKKGRS